MKKLFLVISLFVVASISYAGEVSYRDFLANEIDSVKDYAEFVSDENANPQTVWALSRIRLRIRPKVGLSVPFLASLEVKPSIEFFFDQKKK